MGKRLIIKGADFSKNGIKVPTYTEVSRYGTPTITSFTENDVFNVGQNLDVIGDKLSNDITHLMVIPNNLPKDTLDEIRIATHISGTNTYPLLTKDEFVSFNILVECDENVIANLLDAYSKRLGGGIYYQSKSLTTEQQNKLKNTTSFTIVFYKAVN